MADLGNVLREVNSLPAELRATFTRIFQLVLPDLRFGHPKGAQPDPLVNFGGGFFHGTTPTVANTEFSLPHGFGRTPYLAFPVLLLDTVGSQSVRLKVSRAADDRRVYLTSPDTSAPISLVVEG